MNTSSPTLNYLIDDASVLNKTTKKSVNDRLYKLEVCVPSCSSCSDIISTPSHSAADTRCICHKPLILCWQLSCVLRATVSYHSCTTFSLVIAVVVLDPCTPVFPAPSHSCLALPTQNNPLGLPAKHECQPQLCMCRQRQATDLR